MKRTLWMSLFHGTPRSSESMTLEGAFELEASDEECAMNVFLRLSELDGLRGLRSDCPCSRSCCCVVLLERELEAEAVAGGCRSVGAIVDAVQERQQ